MAIWTLQPAGEYSNAGLTAPAFLSRDEAARWTRLQICRALFEGRHRQFFLDNGNTQFNYPEERVNGRILKRYSAFNLLRLVSVKTADLLFGAKAKLDAPGEQQTEHLDQLARRSMLHSRLHTAATQASWAGGAFLAASLWKGEPYIEVVEPDALSPVGEVQPDGQFVAYRHYAIDTIGNGNAVVRLLLITTFEAGVIRRELATLDDQGAIKDRGIDLAKWPRYTTGGVPRPEEPTGVDDRPTVVYLPNQASDQIGVSDYDGLVGQQDAVNAKYAQVIRVLTLHAEPKLRAPQNAADSQGNFRSDSQVVFSDDKDAYGYITWDGQLDAAMKDRDAAVDAFCIAAEMSQVLLGIQKGATPDAARKLRLEATNSLAKVGRKALLFEPAIALAIEVAQRLDQSSPLLRSYPIDPPGVHFRDGLPVDGVDLANEASTWRAAGLMSVEDGVAMRVEDPAAAAIEVQRLSDEKAAAVPTVLMNSGGVLHEPGEAATPRANPTEAA